MDKKEVQKKEAEKLMEDLRIKSLERRSFGLLKTTPLGRIYGVVYFIIGIVSIFIYNLIFNLHILISVLLGIITWFVLSFIVDSILIKRARIDEQLNFLLKTPEGLARLKKQGFTDEKIEEMKKEFEANPLFKKYSLSKK